MFMYIYSDRDCSQTILTRRDRQVVVEKSKFDCTLYFGSYSRFEQCEHTSSEFENFSSNLTNTQQVSSKVIGTKYHQQQAYALAQEILYTTFQKFLSLAVYMNTTVHTTYSYTANAYRQTTDKLMFKSVISTVR